jgi:hypothetical protein
VSELTIIVPTRSRPQSVARVVEAWRATGAFADGAELLFVVDEDDPEYMNYVAAIDRARGDGSQGLVYEEALGWTSAAVWRPLVPKLNEAALNAIADYPGLFAIGFAGDDHLPRTPGWAARYLDVLRRRAGIVYCDDGYQHDNIPTQWAMTADIVTALGKMVPADVEHLYCDNAIRDLGLGAGCLTYLPDVLIEHMHPVAGKGADDPQYRRVNGSEQYRNDRAAYRGWHRSGGYAHDVEIVRNLIEQGVPV